MAGGGLFGSLLGDIGGGVVGGATFRLLLDDSQYQAGLTKAKAEGSTATTQMGGGFTKFGAVAKAGLAVAGIAAIEFAKVSIDAYMHHQQVLAQLQVSLARVPALAHANIDAFTAQADALSKLTGFTNDEILAADTSLSRFNLTQSQLQQLIPLVLDYARATGVDAATAAGNIGRAMLGNARALKAVGIEFHATGNTAKDFATIVTDLQGRVAGAAEAFAKTDAGKIAILHAQFHDLEITTGQQLVPVLTSVVGVMHVLEPVVGVVADHAGLLLHVLEGYLVLKFLPVLLAGIAQGLQAVGASAAAGRVFGLGTAFAGLAGPIAGIAVGLTAIGLGAQKLAQFVPGAGESVQQLGLDLQTLGAKLDAGKTSLGHYVDTLIAMVSWNGSSVMSAQAFSAILQSQLIPAYQKGKLTQEQWNGVIAAGNKLGVSATAMLIEAQAAQKKHAAETQQAAQQQISLAHATAFANSFFGTQIKTVGDLKTAYTTWGKTTAGQVNFVIGDLSNLAGQSHLTAGGIVKDLDKQLVAMKAFGKNLQTIMSDGSAASKALAQQLIGMGQSGAQMASVIAHATPAVREHIINDIGKSMTQAQGIGNSLERTLTGGFNKIAAAILVATGKAKSLQDALNQLNGMKVKAEIDVTEKILAAQPGTGVKHAATGFEGWIYTPTVFHVAEAGQPEYVSVTPKGRSDAGGMSGAPSGGMGHVELNFGDVYIRDEEDADMFARKVEWALGRVVTSRSGL